MEPKYPRTGEPLKRSDEKPAHTGADGRGHLADHTDRLFLQCTRTGKCRCLRRAVCAATDHYAIRPDLWLHADQGHITQLLSILLENALKYTNDGGFVTVTLKKEGRGTLLQIANTCDTLPDVPPARLFDRFYRADAARTQKKGGYGIGLSVAQSITEANHGQITAEYKDGNKICFSVFFRS